MTSQPSFKLLLFRAKEIIMRAIEESDFLSHIDHVQINKIADCMHEEIFVKDQVICRENSFGTQLYVITGKLDPEHIIVSVEG